MQIKTILILIGIFGNNILEAQVDFCQNIYLWDFTTIDNEQNNLTRNTANEIEDILTEIDDCIILQRRNYADIQKQIDNEVQIFSIEGIPSNLKEQLQTIHAERVLFGVVKQDYSYNINIRLSLEHLFTKQIITSSVVIEAKDWINRDLRIQILQNTIKKLLNLDSEIISDENIKSYSAFQLGYILGEIFIAEQENDTTEIMKLQKRFNYDLSRFNITTDIVLTSQNYAELAIIIYSSLNTAKNRINLPYYELAYYHILTYVKYEQNLSFKNSLEKVELALNKINISKKCKHDYELCLQKLKIITNRNDENKLLFNNCLLSLNEIGHYLRNKR